MPANRMSRFEVFIGTWNTTGEVLETEAGPADTLFATDTYRWLPGRLLPLRPRCSSGASRRHAPVPRGAPPDGMRFTL